MRFICIAFVVLIFILALVLKPMGGDCRIFQTNCCQTTFAGEKCGECNSKCSISAEQYQFCRNIWERTNDACPPLCGGDCQDEPVCDNECQGGKISVTATTAPAPATTTTTTRRRRLVRWPHDDSWLNPGRVGVGAPAPQYSSSLGIMMRASKDYNPFIDELEEEMEMRR